MISIIIPFLNEEENLKVLLPTLLKLQNKEIEFLFINDGSKDNSEKVLLAALKKHKPKVKYQYISHGKQIGIGGSFRTGISVANGTHLSMLASDNEDNVSDITDKIELLSSYRSIILYNSNSDEARSIVRRTISLVFRFYLNLRFGVKLIYFNAMGNIYPIDTLRKVTVQSDGFFSLAEIAIKVCQIETAVAHLPRKLNKRIAGEDKAMTFSALWTMVKDYRKCDLKV